MTCWFASLRSIWESAFVVPPSGGGGIASAIPRLKAELRTRYLISCLFLSAVFFAVVFSQTPPSNLEQLLRNSQRHITNEQYERAYQSARQALELSRRQGDKLRESRAINLIAIAAFHTNRIGESIRYFKQVSATADEAGFGRIQSGALIRAGGLLRLIGRYEDALFCLQDGLRIARQLRLKNAEALALSHLGAMYAETADYAKAETLLNEALPIARELRDPEPQATILMRLAFVARERGQWPTALQYCQQAETLIAGQPRKLRHIELLYHLASVYVGLGQYDQARAHFEQAGQLARELRAPQFGAILLGDYADLQLKTKQFTAAYDLSKQAVTLLQRGGGSPHRAAKILATGAEALRALGRHDEAWQNYQQALAALERARAFSIPTEISRAGIVATRHQVYAGAIALLLQLQRPAEAFDVAEAYHARAFLDVLAESALDQVGNELNPPQQAREDELLARVSTIQRQLFQPELAAENEQQLQRELTEAENALELFRLELRRQNPRFATVQAPQPLSHERIATELLDAQTALIEYVVSDQQSFAWIVAQGQVHSVALPGGKELAEAVAAYRTAASSKVASSQAATAIAKLKTQSQWLYQKLLAPLEPHLKQARKLIIVTDGALAYLPFEALAGAPQRTAQAAPFLIERFAISYAPSASALAALRSLKQSNPIKAQGVIAFGDPVYAQTNSELRQLPYTRHEVNAIAALFPAAESRVWLGEKANEPNSKAEDLNQFRYVHFATHALIDEVHPARSGIVLAQAAKEDGQKEEGPKEDGRKEDGMLQMSEVMRLKLNADLVTLSACRTGLGQLLRGEGIIGLTRAFLYAGAESVTVSLWNVNDIATASLMKAFYKGLQQNQAKDDALRRAKLELLKGAQPAWHHPYYWAAFVLVGDPQ